MFYSIQKVPFDVRFNFETDVVYNVMLWKEHPPPPLTALKKNFYRLSSFLKSLEIWKNISQWEKDVYRTSAGRTNYVSSSLSTWDPIWTLFVWDILGTSKASPIYKVLQNDVS